MGFGICEKERATPEIQCGDRSIETKIRTISGTRLREGTFSKRDRKSRGRLGILAGENCSGRSVRIAE